MNTFDILMRICEKREEFLSKGLSAHEALTKATHDISEEYHVCFASITRLVAIDKLT